VIFARGVVVSIRVDLGDFSDEVSVDSVSSRDRFVWLLLVWLASEWGIVGLDF